MRFAIVGFDLDGTLLDTSRDLAAAVNHALAIDGRDPLPVARIMPMIGGGARHMLAQALDATGGHDEAMLDRLEQALTEFYEANICVETRPYPGLIETLDALAAQGIRLGVATNKRERFSRLLLDRLGLANRFACIIGGDTLGPGRGKPAPDMIRALIEQCGGGPATFVGDSIYDVKAARAADIPAIVCRFGFQPQSVETMGADAIIDHYDALVPTLERI